VTTTDVISLPDRQRWPDLATVPRTWLRAAVAAALMRRLAARVPLRIVSNGQPRGSSPAGAPVLTLHRPRAFHRRLGARGLIGFAEAYQAGDWDADDLAGLLSAVGDAVLTPRLRYLRRLGRMRHLTLLRPLLGVRVPPDDENTVEGARRNIHHHYDLSNDLFANFLDESMTYSSALFDHGPGPAEATSPDLAAAQRRKIDRLLDHAGVGEGTRVLEIGTGWGELAIRAARRGARVHSITISVEQRDLALRRVAEAGVADRVTVDLCDYRLVEPLDDKAYDAILSVEMIEAVGERYWPTYFATMDRLLAPGGRVGLQAITMPDDRMRAARRTYTWLQKYIFPGGVIISAEAIGRVLAAHTGLRVRERYAFGQHYAATLRLWRERFTEKAAAVAALGFDETFRRTWEFYLAYCEAGFTTGHLDVQQFILDRRSARATT
jgi:cyclopropane-fatty-acyl-phospholipid synthase